MMNVNWWLTLDAHERFMAYGTACGGVMLLMPHPQQLMLGQVTSWIHDARFAMSHNRPFKQTFPDGTIERLLTEEVFDEDVFESIQVICWFAHDMREINAGISF